MKLVRLLIAVVCCGIYISLSGCSDNDEKETVVILATEAEQREIVTINGNYFLRHGKDGTLVAVFPTCGMYDESPYKIYMINPDDRDYESMVDNYIWVKGKASLNKKIYYPDGRYDFYYTLAVEEMVLYEDYINNEMSAL